MSLMPTCHTVAEVSSRDQLAGLGKWRRAGVRWHLFCCRDCRAYVEQIRAIGQAARELLAGEGRGIEPEVLDRLEASILERLAGGPDRDHPPCAAS